MLTGRDLPEKMSSGIARRIFAVAKGNFLLQKEVVLIKQVLTVLAT